MDLTTRTNTTTNVIAAGSSSTNNENRGSLNNIKPSEFDELDVRKFIALLEGYFLK